MVCYMTDSPRSEPNPAKPSESRAAQPPASGPVQPGGSGPVEPSAPTPAEPPGIRRLGPQRAGTGARPQIHGFFVQAPIPPLDEDGIVVMSVGTAVFGEAALVLWLLWDRLMAAHHAWWLAVALAGVVIGLLGLLYCWRRRGR
jgi:hypothetical protein